MHRNPIVEDLIDHADRQIEAVLRRTGDLLDEAPDRNMLMIALFGRILSRIAQELTETEIKGDTADDLRETTEALLVTTTIVIRTLGVDRDVPEIDPIRLEARGNALWKRLIQTGQARRRR